MDDEGNLTYATDKHYATMIRTYEEGHVILEQYFDAEGEPAVQTKGYCALSRSFNEEGLADVITYLDAEGKPTVISSGYNAIHRTYNGLHLAETDTYYIDDEQVRHQNGFYAYHREYDENKRVREITYLDREGNLTLHKNGYARATRTYNEAGKIEYEFYFGTDGAPVLTGSGYYGLYREYDQKGNTTVSTYLNAEGQPMNGRRGYSTVIKTYRDDGTLETARYYDKEGKPVTVGKSQFGIEYINGQQVYLDEEGDRQLRLDNFLNIHPLAVILFGAFSIIAAVLLRGWKKSVFLFLYVAFILYMTFWYREAGEARQRLELFWSYRQFFSNRALGREIIYNIWLFIPLGAALSDRKHGWIPALVLSVVIEGIQFFAGLGLCELDDVISNGAGALLGYSLSRMGKTDV